MKRTGAWLAVYALEQLGVTHTFGIPGVHTTELYDELDRSRKIKPVLVTHEGGGAFMADAVSRTSNTVGTLVIVPAAGATHAMSGIGEAFLDGIPMLVISGGIRRDTGRSYQLHDIDQIALMKNITKGAWLVESHREIVPTIFRAWETALTGVPGPVFVEIPVNLQLFRGEIDELPVYKSDIPVTVPDMKQVSDAAELLRSAKRPGFFLGWGARHATAEAIRLAERLNAPVCTTLQGLSVFPSDHPLHAGMGFGPYSVPAAESAFCDCDLLLAVGTRFSEIPTGSFGMPVPAGLIHIDIDPLVFNKNYPATIAITGDAKITLHELNQLLAEMPAPGSVPSEQKTAALNAASTSVQTIDMDTTPGYDDAFTRSVKQSGNTAVPDTSVVNDDVGKKAVQAMTGNASRGEATPESPAVKKATVNTTAMKGQSDVRGRIRRAKARYRREWEASSVPGRVNPAVFFNELRLQLADDAIVALDDGNHTFLAAELFPVHSSGGLICPTDFNCMGYCVPAAIGAKMVNPGRQVAGITGDGAFLMTGIELLTAVTHRIGVVIFVFSDGELSQISQGQSIPYNRKTCTVLGRMKTEGFALATGASWLTMNSNSEAGPVIREAFGLAEGGKPVIVDVRIDYSKRTRFTKGIVQTNLKRFPLAEKLRFIGRALYRKISG